MHSFLLGGAAHCQPSAGLRNHSFLGSRDEFVIYKRDYLSTQNVPRAIIVISNISESMLWLRFLILWTDSCSILHCCVYGRSPWCRTWFLLHSTILFNIQPTTFFRKDEPLRAIVGSGPGIEGRNIQYNVFDSSSGRLARIEVGLCTCYVTSHGLPTVFKWCELSTVSVIQREVWEWFLVFQCVAVGAGCRLTEEIVCTISVSHERRESFANGGALWTRSMRIVTPALL